MPPVKQFHFWVMVKFEDSTLPRSVWSIEDVIGLLDAADKKAA
jgi:hypothetical protein